MGSVRLVRYNKNPILAPIGDRLHWWESRSVFNAGAAVLDNRIYLLYRAMGQLHHSTLGLAILKDPFTIEERMLHPFVQPREGDKYEALGVEDPRITLVEGRFYIVYNGVSIHQDISQSVPLWEHMWVPWRLSCSMMSTDDFIHQVHHGVILPDYDTKNGVLFPEKLVESYMLLHRLYPDLYLSFSQAIDYFTKGVKLIGPRPGMWDGERVGAGAPPIKTEIGWLLFYHGNQKFTDGSFKYSLGILLLDLKDPTKILYRSDEPILEPETDYETRGYVPNVVFTCGAIEWGEHYYVYYGAADTVVGVAYVSKRELLDYLKSNLKI